MKLKAKYKAILNYVVGPILFVVLTFSIYQKIKEQPHLAQSWQGIKQTFIDNKYLLLLMFLLMGINWSLEARKWQLLINSVQKVSLFTGFKAVLSGLSFSLFIPNGLGDYLGKMLYMDEGNRLRSVAVSFVGSFAQLIVTLFFGVIGLVYVMHNILFSNSIFFGLSFFWIKVLAAVVGFGVIFCTIFYFKISLFVKWFEKIPFVYKHRIFINSLEEFDFKLLLEILLLSMVRYAVFIVQYLLVFYLFSLEIPTISAIWLITLLFLSMAIVPTIPIAELGVRGEISIKIFGLLTANTLGIISVVGFVFLINIILPSLVGSLFVLSLKVFKKNMKKKKIADGV